MTLAELLRDRDRIEMFLRACTDAVDPAATEPPIEQIADDWRRIGLAPGDIVLIALPNGRFLLRHLFGALAAGATPALLPPASPAGRLEMIADLFGARAIVATRARRLRYEGSWHDVGGAESILLPVALRLAQGTPGDMILMTSGTSGIGSGCLFHVDALLRNAAKHAQAVGITGDDTLLISLPLQFSYALVAQAFAALLRDARVVISGPPFGVDTYARLIAEHGVTMSSITPMLVRLLLAERTAMPPLRVLTVGGDQLPATNVAEMLRRDFSRELYVTYGLSEAGPRVATLAAHAEPEHRFASVGLPLPGTRAILADGPDGEPRELLISSDTLMKMRVGASADEQVRVWRGPNLLATGDLFTIDADGYLYFRGRASDFTVTGGEKVCLASIRNVAASLPGVVTARTNVVHRDGDLSFDLILTLRDPSRLTIASVRDELNRLLTRAERPRNIEIVPAQTSAAYK